MTTDTLTSWPLVEMRDGRPHWHVSGTKDPPQYEIDPYLESLWRAAQKPCKLQQLDMMEILELEHQDAVNA